MSFSPVYMNAKNMFEKKFLYKNATFLLMSTEQREQTGISPCNPHSTSPILPQTIYDRRFIKFWLMIIATNGCCCPKLEACFQGRQR